MHVMTNIAAQAAFGLLKCIYISVTNEVRGESVR